MKQFVLLVVFLVLPFGAGFVYPYVQANPQYVEWLMTGLSVYVLFFSVVLHELAHGLAAYYCGDPTAKEAGRLTVNPFSHIDPIGTLFVPIGLALMKSETMIGWAKPVPFTPTSLRQHPRDQVFLAFAGPLTNFTLAYLSFTAYLIIGLVFKQLFPTTHVPMLMDIWATLTFPGLPFEPFWIVLFKLLGFSMITNAVLGVFNLIPFPPLDGSWLLKAVLPKKLTVWMGKLQTYGWILFLVLAFSGALRVFIYPVILMIGIFSWIANFVFY